MSKFTRSFFILSALAIPAIAIADTKAEEISVHEMKITYVPAEAATSYGFERLEREIRRAAKKVCGMPATARGRTGTVRQIMESRQCYDRAVADAMTLVTEKTAQYNKRIASN